MSRFLLRRRDKNEMEALITNHVKEYVLTNMWYKFCRGNRLLIDIFGKLLYLSGLDRYRIVPYTSFCVQCLLLYQDGAKFLIILMIPEPCSTHQYLHVYARWSTFSDWFHNVSFTMQSHDQNGSIPLISISYAMLVSVRELTALWKLEI